MRFNFGPDRRFLTRPSLHRSLGAGRVCFLTVGSVTGAGAGEVVRRVAVMGTWLEVRAESASAGVAETAAERAVEAVEAAEVRLSTWRSGTELARLNRAPVGKWQRISKELARDLAEARSWWRSTGGAFNPAVGALVQVWGVRSRGQVPTERELAEALEASRGEGLDLDGGRARRLVEGLAIEEGGFGKGAALADAVAAVSGVEVCVVIDLGGQVAFGGRCSPQVVDLAHPGRRDEIVASLVVGAGSVATSGNAVHRFEVGSTRFGHLLDPRSGRPAQVRGSATVLSHDPIAADCLATALAVMGTDALEWLANHREVKAVLAWPDAVGVRLVATQGAAAHLVEVSGGVKLVTITSPEPVS